MMTADDLLNDDVLLPGDVVLDMTNHRPMQVTGYSQKSASEVDVVWDSNVNQEFYGLDPGARLVELVSVPTGSHYYIPEGVRTYPEARLGRVLTEPATRERRVQSKVVRSVLSHLVGDLRRRGGENTAEALLKLIEENLSRDFRQEVDEFSRVVIEDGG